MKPSRYNIFTPDEGDKVILLNAISKRFFSISRNNYQELKDFLERIASYTPSAEYKPLYNLLLENGFIVKDEEDEFLVIENLFKSYKDAPHYSLLILTTYACNFHCWYCVQKHKSVSIEDPVENRIKRHISKYLTKNHIQSFDISWFGGEPLLNFGTIRSICAWIKRNIVTHLFGASSPTFEVHKTS